MLVSFGPRLIAIDKRQKVLPSRYCVMEYVLQQQQLEVFQPRWLPQLLQVLDVLQRISQLQIFKP